VYRILSTVITVITAPLWLPIALYIAVTYSWADTVPKDEDL